jgi:hypothetical protein
LASTRTKVAVIQPSYIPWRGYFHQIQKADLFVFYDDVQYDKHGWRNRNRIKTSQGSMWLTIPVRARGAPVEHTAIRDIEISWDRAWSQKHWTSLRQAYARAPYFKRYESLLEGFYERHDTLLAELTIDLTIALARELGLADKRFLRSSSYRLHGEKTDRLLELLRTVGAGHYISGPSARGYLEEQKLEDAGIALEYMSYDYAEYRQLHPPYDPQVSILDLLFMRGPEAPELIWPGAA